MHGRLLAVRRFGQALPTTEEDVADAAYRGQFAEQARAYGIDVEIVPRADDQQSFVVQPRRWVGERTLA